MEIDQPAFTDYLLAYSIGLPFTIKSWFFGSSESEPTESKHDYFYLNKDDWELLKKFKSRQNLTVDDKTGIIDISFENI